MPMAKKIIQAMSNDDKKFNLDELIVTISHLALIIFVMYSIIDKFIPA